MILEVTHQDMVACGLNTVADSVGSQNLDRVPDILRLSDLPGMHVHIEFMGSGEGKSILELATVDGSLVSRQTETDSSLFPKLDCQFSSLLSRFGTELSDAVENPANIDGQFIS